jgi:hypothetical protein
MMARIMSRAATSHNYCINFRGGSKKHSTSPRVTSYKFLRSCKGADLTESSRQGRNIKPRLCSGTPTYPLRFQPAGIRWLTLTSSRIPGLLSLLIFNSEIHRSVRTGWRTSSTGERVGHDQAAAGEASSVKMRDIVANFEFIFGAARLHGSQRNRSPCYGSSGALLPSCRAKCCTASEMHMTELCIPFKVYAGQLRAVRP